MVKSEREVFFRRDGMRTYKSYILNDSYIKKKKTIIDK